MATAISSSCCVCSSASASSSQPSHNASNVSQRKSSTSVSAAVTPSPFPSQSHFSCNGGIVSQRRNSTTLSAVASSGCSCHRQQQRNKQPNAAPLIVAPTLVSNRRKTLLPCPRAELNSDTILAVGVGVAGLALGIGIPVFYETQVKGSEERENDQPCFPCNGSGSQTCRFCVGAGNITVELGAGEKEVSKCINCEGAGSITCTTCQGSGIQPRYLDRREYKDED
ncbi:unnamed protein product [Calypogeia fissa]